MSNAEELLSNLRKAKANLAAAKEQSKDAELKFEAAQDGCAEAHRTYNAALAAIELAAQGIELAASQ